MAELELVCIASTYSSRIMMISLMLSLGIGGHNIGPQDIVCVAELVVAITQGHFTRPEELNVRWQARFN